MPNFTRLQRSGLTFPPGIYTFLASGQLKESRSIDLLCHQLQIAYVKFSREAPRHLITATVRTNKCQDKLYAIGRTVDVDKPTVTKASGGKSYHNYGVAFDAYPLDSQGNICWNGSHPLWVEMASAAKSTGLDWGGDFTSVDKPHFQLKNLGKLI